MKIGNEIIINRKRDDVWKIFGNPENLKKWQPTLKKYERQAGRHREAGAGSILIYEEKGREIAMTETITSWNEPTEFSCIYLTSQAANKVSNKFFSLGASKTKWVMDCEISFYGFTWKLLSPLMRGTIRKRIKKLMTQFKKFAEGR
ncbi:MAG: SRPBCC family protein [Acidobacteria bacterium]|nr:SRPBCC family protein [Acidobacteriota bacterium]